MKPWSETPTHNIVRYPPWAAVQKVRFPVVVRMFGFRLDANVLVRPEVDIGGTPRLRNKHLLVLGMQRRIGPAIGVWTYRAVSPVPEWEAADD